MAAELYKPLQELAAERGESVSAIVEQLIAEYLREQRHHYLMDEMERFRRNHADLLREYNGRYVALRDGHVLDHDLNGGALYVRLRSQYGELPILIVEVTAQPEQLYTRTSSRVLP